MKVTYVTPEEAGIVPEKKKKIIDQELDLLFERHGTVTPVLVLREAANPHSKLHPYFEWDDAVAGEKYRLSQATQMLMASKFVALLNSTAKKPADVSAQAASAPLIRRFLPTVRGEGFKMRKEVLSDRDGREIIVARRKEALRSWCREAVDIPELQRIRTLILTEIGEKA